MLKMPVMFKVPLHTDGDGLIRVSNTRVTLSTIIGYYLQGETPEEIYEGFPTVPLSDIYAVITYYLANQDEVNAYIQEIELEGSRLREKIEANYSDDTIAMLARLRQLRDAKRQSNA